MTDRYDSDFIDRLLFGEKLCPTCQAKKPRNSEHFGQDVSTADELTCECRECLTQADRQRHRYRYQTDPEYRERKKASDRKAKAKRRAAA